MKWYSHETYKAHQTAIKHYNRGIGVYYSWVIKIANQFNREYASIGVLDINDLISAGNFGLIQVWHKIDWDRITESPNPEAELWSYLKKRIKWAIRREIDSHGAFIKIPRREIEDARKNMYATDKALVDIFPQFFGETFPDYVEDFEPWDNIRLGELMDDLLLTYIKDYKHIQILRFAYGLDTEKLSIKEIANKFDMSEIGVKKVKSKIY